MHVLCNTNLLNPPPRQASGGDKKKRDDFQFERILGEGSYSTVSYVNTAYCMYVYTFMFENTRIKMGTFLKMNCSYQNTHLLTCFTIKPNAAPSNRG